MAREAAVRDYGGVSAQRRREQRRRKLIDAGRRLWGSGGLEAVSVRGVCAASGLTHRYFYEQFDGRDALIGAVAEDARRQLAQTLLEHSAAAGGSVDERFRAALTAFLHTMSDDPEFHRIMTSDLAGVAGLENWEYETLDLVADLMVQAGAAIPGFALPPGAEARRRARFVVGGVNQLLSGWLADRDVSAAELAQVCTDYLMALARVPAGRSTVTTDSQAMDPA
ncbi:TetR/AcrR family transcriptional regulator [Gordonia sp. VNK21]|uniref:TetR/AcrR family transcriptional regulator n=1 Tax=Gordonia sp. VNK21 TaxID=3382483 RepID=UPI0038D44C07